MSWRHAPIGCLVALALCGCSHQEAFETSDGPAAAGWFAHVVPAGLAADHHQIAWGEPEVTHMPRGPRMVAESDGPYLLDSGDKLRVFVYGQPNLSRIYPVDHAGNISVPLIGSLHARGHTTRGVERAIRSRLGATYVKDPQVTVDISQNRPFFILGEVRIAGQYPYVSGMTAQVAVAIAGGFTERANERKVQITRRINGAIEKIEAPTDYVVQPGDTVYVSERWF